MTARARLAAATAALAVVAFALAGCSRGGDLSAESPAGPSTTGGGGAALGDPFDRSDPEFDEELLSFYNEFHSAADAHRIPTDFTREYGSGLEELADPPVVAYYDAWRAANEAHGDGFQRVKSFFTSSNVLSVDVDGARATIRDCTREDRILIDGADITDWVTRVVTVANHGGLYRAAALEIVHQGALATPGYACIPRSMADTASDVVRATIDGFAAGQADPAKGLPPALDKVVVDPLQRELASALAEQAAGGMAVTSPTQVSLRVLGLDRRGLGKRVAVVAACIAYPEGLALRDLRSKRVTREVFPAGTVNKVDYAVRLDGPDGPVAFAIMGEERARSC